MDRRIDKVLWHEAQLIVSNEDGKIISIRILTSVDIMERIDDKTGKSILCLSAIVKERKEFAHKVKLPRIKKGKVARDF